MKRFLIYLVRWQLSTPVLWLIITYFNVDNFFIKTVVANFIGGLIFFWIDAYIFGSKEKKLIKNL
ncbi:MAG TPA: hypothetical protein VHT34_12535 [Clostridia bacterium]|nr:hypothetical protein [Clostridia bacterium]